MVSRSKTLVLVVVTTILLIVAVAVVLRNRLRCAGFPGPSVSANEMPAEAASEGTLRIASWNVRNFPLDERPQEFDLGYSRRTNICDFEAAVSGLNADLFGLQEVNDVRRFGPILERACGARPMQVRYSAGGGRFGQHLAIAWDDSVFELVGDPVDIVGLVLNPGMRPAFAGYLRSRRAGGIDFTVVVVHLESGPKKFGQRRRQNRALASWIEGWVEEIDDPDLVVLGDFNTTGSPRGGVEGELQSVDAILGRVGLERLQNPLGCTSYWEGPGDRDGVQVPSLVDHVFVRGFGPETVTAPLEAWLHCSRWQCGELISRPGEEDGTFWDVSDHCPLTFEIQDLDPESQS
jgi:endonuclease/exonuclease/phosphatase family metal-dependent hydrolase